jgi:hypothetical protein
MCGLAIPISRIRTLNFLDSVHMADDPAGVDVDNILGNVGAVIGDALQILGDHDVAQIRGGFLAIGFHQANHVLHDLVIESIDYVVALEDVAGEGLVAEVESFDCVAKGGEDGVGHEPEITGGLVVGNLGERENALGDVDGAIGDALEIGVDLDNGSNGSQIDGRGLLKRQEIDSAFFNANLLIVDALIEADGFLGELGIGGEYSLAGLLDHLKDQSGHAGNLRPEAFEKIVEVM